jgi:hypothetical protein
MRRYEETFRNIYFQSFGSIESKGDSFFVLLDGSVEVIKKEKDGPFVKLVELGPQVHILENRPSLVGLEVITLQVCVLSLLVGL